MGIIKLKNVGDEKEQKTAVNSTGNLHTENFSEKIEKQDVGDPAVLKELSEKNNEISRHYILNNGTAKSVISSIPTNYFDEAEQKWKAIDNSLSEKDQCYEANCGKFKTEIFKPEQSKAIKMTSTDFEISWEYLGKQSAANSETMLFTEEIEPTTLNVDSSIKGALQSKGSRVVYENAEKDTDIEYSLSGNNIKENIIVKEKSEDYKYLFALNTQGLKLRISDNNESLELYSEATNDSGQIEQKIEAIIPAPYMYDANGISSDDVYFELVPKTEGKYTFAVVANEEWVNAADRAFPVTIDPQVITNQNNLITKQTYYRNVYSSYGSGSGSGISYSSWYTTSSIYIKVYKTTNIEYKTNLTIKRSLINLMEGKISSVKLILTPYGSFSGRMYVNGSLTNYYYTSSGKLTLDITSKFKSNAGDFIVTLEPYTTNSNMQFYLSDYPPVVEIEYLTNENVYPTKKTFTLAGIATGEVNLVTGSMVTSICDVKPENSVMGLGIYHIHKKNADNYSLGGNFRLNLNETFVKHSERDYVYTDANGDKHGFNEYYYYINASGNKEYIGKDVVTIDAEGKMTCNVGEQIYPVTCEYKSTSGLKAMTKIEGVNNIEYFEQRTEEYKKIETSFKEYEYGLKEFVRLNKLTGTIVDRFKDYDRINVNNYETFKSNLSENEMILPVSDAINLISAKLQVQVLGYQNVSYSHENSSISLQLNSILNKNGLCPSELGYISQQRSAMDNQNDLLDYQKTYYDNAGIDNDQKDYAKEYYTSLKNKIDEQKEDLENQRTYLSVKEDEIQNQYNEANSQYSILLSQRNNINNIKDENEAQSEHCIEQINLIISKKEFYLEQFAKMFTEYLSIEVQYEKMNMQLPINFITDGKIIKGYNSEGILVAIYDRYDNYIAIEYESYYVGETEKKRIARAYDNTEKQVVFSYNESDQLTRITDVRGRNTCFTYNSSNQLIGITYDSGENVSLAYSNNNIYSIKEEKRGLISYINYSYNRPINITHYSTVDNISLNEASTGSNIFMSQCIITYIPGASYPITNTTVTENLAMERYYFDDKGNCTGYRKAIFDSASQQYLVSEAEQYTHNPYWIGSEKQSDPKEVVVYAAKSSLNKTTIDSYSFVAGDTKTTVIDQFNNPVSKTTNAILVSEWTDMNGDIQQNKQTTVISYAYDENQKLLCETTTVTYSNPVNTVVSYKKYQYNGYGDVIRTESYIESEEFTNGKNIEETVYDDKGNVVKNFSYNSLDTSSKFYSETEYDENGKVNAEVDETGENWIKFVYKDGTDIVCEEQLPNGSKFAYGLDSDDGVTAISQSTEEGEENSTQRVYRSGELVELTSGNNKVKYTYNHKRKLKSVYLNGEENYVTYNYEETTDSIGAVYAETVTATYKSGDVFVTQKDGKGNVLQTKVNNVVQFENTYDKNNNLVTVKDKIAGKNYQFERDELERVTAVYEIDENGVQVSDGYGENIEYDEVGALKKRTIVGSVSQVYNYTYKTDSERAIESIAFDNVNVKPKLDIFDRNKGKEILFNNAKIAEENISYRKVGDHATQMPSTIWFGDKANGSYQVKDSVRYAYDKMGNIEKVYENGELAIRYHYDALNRLVREDNKVLDKTIIFVYDNNGNIVKQRQFSFTLKDNVLIEELESADKAYIYDGDKLLSFNGQACAYDAIGNPTTYCGKTATWAKGRQLVSYDGHTFTYDGQGRRTTKDSIAYIYDINGKLLKQSNGLEFFYDHTGVAGIKYNSATYLYRKDVLGNILAILDSNGAVVARYLYDAWGNHSVVNANGTNISDTTHIANLNPFRYRGYYYDTETKLYFLKTRYYDPETGRFMTIDGIENIDAENLNGLNLYAYCLNNPVMKVDPMGTLGWLAILVISLIAAAAVGGAVYAGVTAYQNGARGWELFGAIAEGFFKGAVVGAIISGIIALLVYAAPAIGSFLGSSFQIGAYLTAAGELVAVTVTGAQIIAAGAATLVSLGIMFSSTNRPGDNRKQNEQYREAMRRLGYSKKDWQWRYGHDHLPNESLGFKDLLKFLKNLFSKFK